MESAGLEWKTEQRKIDDLLPYPKNPRTLTQTQQDNLLASLKFFGLVEIPVVNTDGTIIAGHQRLRVLQMLGRGSDVVDVRVPNRLLTDDEVARYCLTSNSVHGEFDVDKLTSEFDNELLALVGISIAREVETVERDAQAEAAGIATHLFSVVVQCDDQALADELATEIMGRGFEVKVKRSRKRANVKSAENTG